AIFAAIGRTTFWTIHISLYPYKLGKCSKCYTNLTIPQKKPREQGNSVFVNDNFVPYPDQWAYLSTVKRITPMQLSHLIGNAE
ncbi:TOTE conflict system archaeo-eukaryotic primase domain-containing protein, partial [Methyloglobulus morosus]|uniref:TOTE conflict system archaeo-eukaryotic primase domain-containing protein n=1 Tax=Methyloglobulus morosus TaxID=1410681 RepID=UPI001F1A3349